MTVDRRPSDPATVRHPAVSDVIVVGDGVIGLAVALAVARLGGTVCIIGYSAPGAASGASAGLLAPSIGVAAPHVRTFLTAARDRFPSYIRWLAERTGVDVPLDRSGIIELGSGDPAIENGAVRLDAPGLRAVEPAVAATEAILHSADGYVDNVRLLDAMHEAARCEWSIDVVKGRAARVHCTGTQRAVITEDGRRHEGDTIILAAGAWTPLIDGLPRPVRVEPARGQMIRLRGCPLEHAVSARDAYLVPRGEFTLVGSTLERVGFDVRTTREAVEHLHAVAGEVVPELAAAELVDRWAGLRPMSPDAMPILGRDPEEPALVYACGHGKNGILSAPLTGECIAALVAGTPPPGDIGAFGIERFL